MVKPELLSYYATLKDVLKTDYDLLIKYKSRLRLIREMNSRKATYECYDPNVDGCDMLSDTTSIKSSQISTNSSKTGYRIFSQISAIYFNANFTEKHFVRAKTVENTNAKY